MISVTRHRNTPAGVDQYGDPTGVTPDALTVSGCAVAPRSSSEPTERGRVGVIVGLTLYAPYGSDIIHTDQIEVDGTVYDIEGEPGLWANPFTGSRPGMEVALKRAEG